MTASEAQYQEWMEVDLEVGEQPPPHAAAVPLPSADMLLQCTDLPPLLTI